VLGDFNTQADTPHILELRDTLALQAPTRGMPTYPSWQPQRAIDHVLVSKTLRVGVAEVLDVTFSDHCPVALEISLPRGLHLQEATRPVISVETGTGLQN
jgi:endonuclease/exonuclease/phosphatase family metal-dependent hydrolase